MRNGAIMFEDNGNKCGKCQNHDYEVLKKGHARDCPFKRCDCLKCRLLDARSDILQVISGKETKLKGTKKDPNCGFCQNHGIKILRKGHVRSCGFGQERHFRLENCFDCEVHYIRNEVNRLQIKMRRAMKEDRTLSEEQRRTAREPITRDEVENVCDMARSARKKRETISATQQVGETSALQQPRQPQQAPMRHTAALANGQHGRRAQQQQARESKSSRAAQVAAARALHAHEQQQQQQLGINLATHRSAPSDANNQASVWRPWSQQQVVAAGAFASQRPQPQPPPPLPPQQPQPTEQPVCLHSAPFARANEHLLELQAAAQTTDQLCLQPKLEPRQSTPLPLAPAQPHQHFDATSMLSVYMAGDSNQALDLAEQHPARVAPQQQLQAAFQEQQQQQHDMQLQRDQLYSAIFRLFFDQLAQSAVPGQASAAHGGTHNR